MMRSEQYTTILNKKFVPELKKQYTDGTGIFQQDLVPCHTSKMVKNFMSENQTETLKWPGNSSDINRIKNLWAICKNRLLNVDCTSIKKLITVLTHVWYKDTNIMNDCKKLVESMPNRVQKLIKSRGDHIMC